MKKVLLILLALLIVVGGVVFADGEDAPVLAVPGEATLTLKAKPIAAVLKHGFVAAETTGEGENATEIIYNSFAAISEMFDADVDGGVSRTHDVLFDLESDEAIPVGYYYFVANTPNTGYTVNFTVNPFEKLGTDIKVPLRLNLESVGVVNNATLTIPASPGISTVGDVGDGVTASAETLVLKTTSSEESTPSSYAGIKLTASTTGTENLAFGLPADTGDSVFTATVVASVTTN